MILGPIIHVPPSPQGLYPSPPLRVSRLNERVSTLSDIQFRMRRNLEGLYGGSPGLEAQVSSVSRFLSEQEEYLLLKINGHKKIDEGEKNLLKSFLERLQKGHFYRANPEKYIRQIEELFDFALENASFKDTLFVQLKENDSDCQDRALFALKNLNISKAVHSLDQKAGLDEKLKHLFSIAKSQTLEKIISQIPGISHDGENVETYLYFQNKLRERLGLYDSGQSGDYEHFVGAKEHYERQIEEKLKDFESKAFAELKDMDALKELFEKDEEFNQNKQKLCEFITDLIDPGKELQDIVRICENIKKIASEKGIFDDEIESKLETLQTLQNPEAFHKLCTQGKDFFDIVEKKLKEKALEKHLKVVNNKPQTANTRQILPRIISQSSSNLQGQNAAEIRSRVDSAIRHSHAMGTEYPQTDHFHTSNHLGYSSILPNPHSSSTPSTRTNQIVDRICTRIDAEISWIQAERQREHQRELERAHQIALQRERQRELERAHQIALQRERQRAHQIALQIERQRALPSSFQERFTFTAQRPSPLRDLMARTACLNPRFYPASQRHVHVEESARAPSSYAARRYASPNYRELERRELERKIERECIRIHAENIEFLRGLAPRPPQGYTF